MNYDDKKLYIYKNIDSINNHNDIINHIISNDIKYTNNDNGFFINISYLENDIIDYIYNTIRYYIKNTDESQLFIDKRDEIIKLNNTYHKVKKICNIPLDDFNDEEQSIIRQSKKFKI